MEETNFKKDEIRSNLKLIVDGFENIERILTPSQKKQGIRALGVDLRYLPIRGFEQISAEYVCNGKRYEIKISHGGSN